MKKKRIIIVLIALITIGVLVKLGLPVVMTGIGLHAEYEGQQRYENVINRILPLGKLSIR